MGGLLPLAGVVSVTLPPVGGKTKTCGRKKSSLTGRDGRFWRCFEHLLKSIGRYGGGCQEILIDIVNTHSKMFTMDIHYELNGESFVWNAHKAAVNLSNHGIRFEEATWVFLDPMFVVLDASRNDEARDAAIGCDAYGRLLFVVHIEIEGEAIRIISARKANPNEEMRYAQ